jgi:hypothetical protein
MRPSSTGKCWTARCKVDSNQKSAKGRHDTHHAVESGVFVFVCVCVCVCVCVVFCVFCVVYFVWCVCTIRVILCGGVSDVWHSFDGHDRRWRATTQELFPKI